MDILDPGIWYSGSDQWYMIGRGGEGIKINEFTFKKIGILLDNNEWNAVNSLYRDKGQEFLESFSKDTIVVILGMAAGPYSPVVSAGAFAFNTALNNAEADRINAQLDEVKRDITIRENFEAMQAGGIVSTSNGTVNIYGICIDERKLQIALNAYNSRYQGGDESIKVSMETLMNEFYNNYGTKDSKILNHYVTWYMNDDGELDKYRDSLEGILSDYRVQHPELPYNKLSDLTPTQINELDKKMRNSDYELILEVLP